MNDQDMTQVYPTWVEKSTIDQPNNPLEPLIASIVSP
jgi:hypothetical protein